jgi:hypothetical protein
MKRRLAIIGLCIEDGARIALLVFLSLAALVFLVHATLALSPHEMVESPLDPSPYLGTIRSQMWVSPLGCHCSVNQTDLEIATRRNPHIGWRRNLHG